MYDSYLAHHGVKGMKWGVRRSKKAIKKMNKASKRNAELGYTMQESKKAYDSLSPEGRKRRWLVNGQPYTTEEYYKQSMSESKKEKKQMEREIEMNGETVLSGIPKDKYALGVQYIEHEIYGIAYPKYSLEKVKNRG